jgi:hypothetical protein
MTDASARFALPLLQRGQAQKEMFHNEALTLIDALLHPVVEAMGETAPPAQPTPGQGWIVGESPGGDWVGKAGHIAVWTVGGWRFAAPVAGMTAWIAGAKVWAVHDGATWTSGDLPASRLSIGGQQVVGPRQPAIADPAGGTSIDGEARATLAAVLVALRTHGLIAA